MWHASASWHVNYRPVDTANLPRPVVAQLERRLKRLLAGVGAGPRKWQHGTRRRGGHVVHVRRSLSDDEIAKLPPGPDATVRGGDFGGTYACRTIAP